MGHACDNTSLETDINNFSCEESTDPSSDQLRSRNNVSSSTRSSESTGVSMRSGSTLAEIDDLLDSSLDRESLTNEQEILPERLKQNSGTHPKRDVPPPPIPPRQLETIPPAVPSRNYPMPQYSHEVFTFPSSFETNNELQPHHLSGTRRQQPEENTEAPPLRTLQRAPPNPCSSTLAKPSVPPKPTTFYLEPIYPAKPDSTNNTKLKLPLTRKNLAPNISTDPNDDYLLPLLLRKPQKNSIQRPLPPNPPQNSIQNQPPLPPQSQQYNQQPSLSSEPRAQEIAPPALPPRSAQQGQNLDDSHVLLQQNPHPLPSTTSSISDIDAGHIVDPQPVDLPELHKNERTQYRKLKRPHFLLSNKCLLTTGIVSFLLSLISIALLVLVIVNPFTYLWQEKTFREKSFKTCIKCLHLMRGMEDYEAINGMHNLDNVAKDGEMYCCAMKSEQLSVLLTLILRQQNATRGETNVANPSIKTPSAHVELTANVWTSTSTSRLVPDKHYIIKLNESSYKNKNNNEHTQGVRVKENWLEVQVTGWYYVYSNVYYNVQYNSSCHGNKVLEHHIRRRSNEKPNNGGILVKTAHTRTLDYKQNYKESVFAGGIFQLLKDDEIFFSSTSTCFDIYKMPNMGLIMLGQ